MTKREPNATMALDLRARTPLGAGHFAVWRQIVTEPEPVETEEPAAGEEAEESTETPAEPEAE